MSDSLPPRRPYDSTPLRLPKITRPPMVPGVPESPSGLHRAFSAVSGDVVKMRRTSRYKMYAAVSGLLATIYGGKVAYSKGDSLETKHAVLQNDHENLVKKVDDLALRLDAGEKSQQKTALRVERVEVMIEMELKQHGLKLPPKTEEP